MQLIGVVPLPVLARTPQATPTTRARAVTTITIFRMAASFQRTRSAGRYDRCPDSASGGPIGPSENKDAGVWREVATADRRGIGREPGEARGHARTGPSRSPSTSP